MNDAEPAVRKLIGNLRRVLRIAVVTETYPPEVNGVAMTIGRVVQGLRARGHQIQLVRPRQGRDDAPRHDQGLEQVLRPGLSIPRYDALKMGLPGRGALERLWRERRPDVVHVVTEGPLGWSAVSAARRLGIPVSSDFHTNFHSYSQHYGIGFLKRPIMGYLRTLHNRADCTMVPTDSLRRDLEAAGYRGVKVVARGVDTGLFNPSRRSADLRRAWGVADQGLAVISVGRIAPEKNLALTLAAFDAIRAEVPEARLVLVGDGPARGELEEAHPEHVFAGMRLGDELAAHYASGDLFLFPSLTETYGNVTVEAMASGLPVVAYDYAAAAEHIRHAETGVLAPFDDADEFLRLARALARDPVRLRTMGAAARRAAEALTWERIFDDLEGVLHEVIARPGDGRGSGRRRE